MKLSQKHKSMPIIVVIVVVAVLIPIAIHFLFVPESEQALVASRWSAGELLNYCGSILSALATIFAIILTISFTVENQKKERKLAVKPYLHLWHSHLLNFNELSDNLIYFTIGNEFEYSNEMPFCMRKVCGEKDAFGKVTEMCGFRMHNHAILYALSNVGAGNALNVEISINGHQFNIPMAIPLNTTLRFVLLLKEELLIEDKKELKIAITYSDVASIARYEQNEKIELLRDPKDECLTSWQDINWFWSNPIEIKCS